MNWSYYYYKRMRERAKLIIKIGLAYVGIGVFFALTEPFLWTRLLLASIIPLGILTEFLGIKEFNRWAYYYDDEKNFVAFDGEELRNALNPD